MASCEGVLPWISRLQNICPSCPPKPVSSDTDDAFEQTQEEHKRDKKVRRTVTQRLRRHRMRVILLLFLNLLFMANNHSH